MALSRPRVPFLEILLDDIEQPLPALPLAFDPIRGFGKRLWHRASRWVLPSITRLTTPASSNIFRCREMVGLDTPKSPLTSPTVAAPPLSRSTISRRSGCASALNTSLAIVLTIRADAADPDRG
jgi:hypothetical protein